MVGEGRGAGTPTAGEDRAEVETGHAVVVHDVMSLDLCPGILTVLFSHGRKKARGIRQSRSEVRSAEEIRRGNDILHVYNHNYRRI